MAEVLGGLGIGLIMCLAAFLLVLFLFAPLVLYGIYSRLCAVTDLLREQNRLLKTTAMLQHEAPSPSSLSVAAATAPTFKTLY